MIKDFAAFLKRKGCIFIKNETFFPCFLGGKDLTITAFLCIMIVIVFKNEKVKKLCK